MAHTTITFHGVEVTLPAGVSFSSDGTTLTLDLSAGFAGVLRLRGGAPLACQAHPLSSPPATPLLTVC